ncbi:hypothetical protein Pint_35275 [Pistacia integerrima]|uniref:Uncharacterized protein n=1 Tax=Pistacia integerrima TaxID=434235 RepID=A0ACC0Y090_9ROSI|nr:hypothetical protein Pint_35275 [Pistacia integerrima]
MSVQEMSHVDIEQGGTENDGHHRHSIAGSDVSVCFSDAEDGGSCYSQFYSTTAGSYDEYSFTCVSDAAVSRRVSSVSSSSDCSVEIESQGGEVEIKVHMDSSKVEGEKDCRICHLGLESSSHESGIAIQLGCSCKDDLAVAHKQCAEAWFKIRGNKNLYVTLPGSLSFCESGDLPPDWMTCEICNSIARNVAGATEMEAIEQSNETNSATAMSSVSASAHHGETRNFWHGHRFLNFLLACMVFAFVISWLFHFNVPSS